MSEIKPILPSEKPAPVAAILEEQAGGMPPAPKASLVNVKYMNILPDQKTSGYTEQQKAQFTIPSDIGYFDPKQSYLNVVVRPTSTYASSALTNLTGYGVYPCCLPPNVGAHSLFSRIQLQSADGKTIARFLDAMSNVNMAAAANKQMQAEWQSQNGNLGNSKRDLDVLGIKVPKGMTYQKFASTNMGKAVNQISKMNSQQAISRGTASYMKYGQ